MGYDYAIERKHVFTEEGSKMLLQIRDTAKDLIAKAGVARCDKMMAKCTGDSWRMLACIDWLVETGDIIEIPNPTSGAAQHRVFITYEGGA